MKLEGRRAEGRRWVVNSKHNTVRFEVLMVTTKIPTCWQPLLKMEISSYSKILLPTYQST
jgi:hypothetical protein